MRVVYAAAALARLEAIRTHIARDNPVAAARVVERLIIEAAESLAFFPQRGVAGRKPGTRRLVLPDLPYSLDYRVRGDVVEILAAWHGAQRR
jgi:toxin ParE1/3/4